MAGWWRWIPPRGKQLWAYDLPTGDQPPFRGLGYWPGDKAHAPRLIFGTLRGRMIALDARTGAPSKGFGENGIIDTKTPEIMNGLPDAFYGYSAPPTIYKNLAITGSRVQEAPSKGAAGDARAWDVVTGKLVWTFHSIPRPGEKFHETWEDDGWKQKSGVNIWNMLTVDTARGIAYLPFGAPTFDRYGGNHKGANLFSNSLVAVDASTGKYLWHFQTVHHDIWDLDLHTTPVLLTVKKDGKIHSRRGGDEQDGDAVPAQPRHRRADLRRDGKAGAAVFASRTRRPGRPSPFPTSPKS